MQTIHKIPGDSATRYAQYLTSTEPAATTTPATAAPSIGAEPLARLAGFSASLGLDPEGLVERSICAR